MQFWSAKISSSTRWKAPWFGLFPAAAPVPDPFPSWITVCGAPQIVESGLHTLPPLAQQCGFARGWAQKGRAVQWAALGSSPEVTAVI